MLRQAREKAGLTQEQVANRLGTKNRLSWCACEHAVRRRFGRTAISRIENHAEDVRLSTLRAYAMAVGAELQIQFVNETKRRQS